MADLYEEMNESALLLVPIHLHRGEISEARRAFERADKDRDPDHAESEAWWFSYEALLLLWEGRPKDALAAAGRALALRDRAGTLTFGVKWGFTYGLEAALTLGDEAKVDELLGALEAIPPGHTSPMLRAIGARFSARRAALHDDVATADAGFAAAEEIYRSVPAPLDLAATRVEHAEWLTAQGRADDAEPLLAEAEALWGRLRATPWLERIARCRAGAPAVTTA